MNVAAHGGELINLIVDEDRGEEFKSTSQEFPNVTLSQRQICDLELLMNGGLSPLKGFMSEQCYNSVVNDMRLPDGTLWPVPITMDVPDSLAESISIGARLALCDAEGFMVAVLTVDSIWSPDKDVEAEKIYGTSSIEHPGVQYLFENVHNTYIGGSIEGVQLPLHFDFETLRDTPEELRALFLKMGWSNVVAFHSSKPMHRLHRDITMKAAKEAQAHILLHPAVGMTKPGDLHYYARVHCYQAIRKYYPHKMAMLSLLPQAMRMAGPKEALLNMIIRQNYGCSHFIVGPEHAAPPNVRDDSKRFYPSYASQKFIAEHQSELKIRMIDIKEMQYAQDRDQFLAVDEIKSTGKKGQSYTNKNLREALEQDHEIPDWFSFPDVIDHLRKVYPTRSKQGITLFFTGLSGSGKSTLAKIMHAKFIEDGQRPVTLLDGDVVRHNLSSELGFSKAHRNINVRRIGFVASEITKNGGIAICAPIAPYADIRREVRSLIEQSGAFIEIHVATSLEICESRDRKGLYAKAREGIIPEFTGISDPYDIPEHPELRINTADSTPMQAAQEIFLYLLGEGYIDGNKEI